ncbi:MAG: flagellar basal body-associated FliL family protein [Desulfopila sp.]|jgi:flagellar FliL protein|nr:flagellar basal body-associated FliL family protein [Desulfopila sp.]
MAEKKAAQKTPDSPESGSKKKKILILIGGLLLLIILAGTALGLFFFFKDDKSEEPESGSTVLVPELNKNMNIGPMVNVDDFIVNIISAESKHYVKASFTLELSNEIVKEEVDRRMPQIRDSILLLLGNKTYEELQDLQGKKQLKAELMSKINAVLISGRVDSIYFTDFVVQ